MLLSSDWDNEAYVSLHLVQEVLEEVGLPKRSDFSHWYPQFTITIPKVGKKNYPSSVDFFIEDRSRDINFLIEVKSASTRIESRARFQLEMYLRYSKVKYGILIDPFLVEAYQFIQGRAKLREQFEIQDPTEVKPIATFLQKFLDTIIGK
jgi:chromosome partitioning protein